MNANPPGVCQIRRRVDGLGVVAEIVPAYFMW
jgi:hypothetical protein